MTFHHTAKLHIRDTDFPERTRRLLIYRSILDGTFYDVLRKEFDEERNSVDGYIPLRERRPSVLNGTRLCGTVVEQSSTMLFGDGRFPNVTIGNADEDKVIADLIRETQLVQRMRDATRRGSVGSVAILMRILPNRQNQLRTFFEVFDTFYLTPEYDNQEPDRLIKITELRKAKGRDLKDAGYAITDEELDRVFWFKRVWDEDSEIWYLPTESVSGVSATWMEDTEKTVHHNLGFCPWVWIRNLNGGEHIDGNCTFEPGIKTCVEIDYLQSQAGRGLRYSMDPMLVIKEPVTPAMMDANGAANDQELLGWHHEDGRRVGGDIVRSADTALVMDVTGDAKMLELNGSSLEAAQKHIEKLRQYAMEAMNGSLVNPDQINSHQGAKALEILHAPLIRLCDNLRSSYGEDGLAALIRMWVRVANTRPMFVMDEVVKIKGKPSAVSLHWHSWFPITEQELGTKVATVTNAVKSGIMSKEKAVAVIASDYDITDIKAELKAIEKDAASALADAQSLMAAKQPADDEADAKGKDEKQASKPAV